MLNLTDLSYKQFRDVIFFSAIIFIIAVSVILIIIFYNNLQFLKQILKGFLIGAVASLLNFRILSNKIEKFGEITKDSNSTNAVSGGLLVKNFFVRYILILIILSIAAMNKKTINIFAAIAGLFAVQITIYILYFIESFYKKTEKKSD